MDTPKYKRVLIKISGEALAGDNKFGLNFDVIGPVCDVVKKCVDIGTEVGIVVGGGNFWRGVKTAAERWSAPVQTIWVCWLQRLTRWRFRMRWSSAV